MHFFFFSGFGSLLLFVLISLLSQGIVNPHVIDTWNVDSPAPDFTLSDLDGRSHRLSHYEGQYVVLEWINLRCRTVDRMYRSGAIPGVQEHMDDEAVWLTITSAPSRKQQGTLTIPQMKRQLEKRGGKQDAVLIDESGDVGQLYGVSVIPFFVVISPEGMILYEGAFDDRPDRDAHGAEDAFNYVEAALHDARSGREVSIATTEPYGCEVKYQR